MKIGSLDPKPITPAPAGDRKVGGSDAGASAPASATVALSPAAAELASGVPTDATFDKAKVERIAQAIRDGEFKINAEAIADKLLSNAQELLGRKPM